MALVLSGQPSQRGADVVLYEQAYPDCSSVRDVDVTDAGSARDDTFIAATADAGQLAGSAAVNSAVCQLLWVLAPAERSLTLRLVRLQKHAARPSTSALGNPRVAH